MKLLVIDTATEACSVALQVDDAVLSRFEICPQQHSQRLLPMVDEVLSEAGLSIADMDYLGFGRGPGSFTGVRIATGMLQGLALGIDRPVVGISTLAAMAQQVMTSGQASQVAVAIDARMNEVYFARYAQDPDAAGPLARLIGEELVLPPEAAAQQLGAKGWVAAGTGWGAYRALSDTRVAGTAPHVLYPSAEYMLPLAQGAINRGEAVGVTEVQPVYLRDKVTWKKLPGRE